MKLNHFAIVLASASLLLANTLFANSLSDCLVLLEDKPSYGFRFEQQQACQDGPLKPQLLHWLQADDTQVVVYSVRNISINEALIFLSRDYTQQNGDAPLSESLIEKIYQLSQQGFYETETPLVTLIEQAHDKKTAKHALVLKLAQKNQYDIITRLAAE